MPIATTFADARAAIVTAIREWTPSYAPGSAATWRPVDQKDKVPSVGVRSYFIEMSAPVGTGEIYGGCELNECDLLVWTSYGGLSEAEGQVYAGTDHQELWTALHRAEIEGVSKFDKAGFEPETEDGRLWGAHVFTAYIFLPLP